MCSHLLFIGMTEILFIALVAFLLFGTKKLPEVAKGLGKGYREFQRAADQIKEEISKVTDDVKKEMDVNEDNSKARNQKSNESTNAN
ncbi:MAG TPA: hypothetical protein DIW31_03310 [Bacteroidales bacterium]|nr:hypothetical protein [Bacteroidales bacterium]